MFNIDFSSLDETAIQALAFDRLKQGGIEPWEKNIWQFIEHFTNSETDSISIHTSGSTGTPKKITHQKQAVFNSAKMTCAALNLKPRSNSLLCLGVDKIGGMMMVVRSLVNRMNLYCIKPTIHPLKQLPANLRFDFVAFTPMQVNDILEDEECSLHAASIANILLGGQETGNNLLKVIREMPNSIYATFGMTETISHIALKKLSGQNPDKHYKTLPGIEVESGENGRLIIRAPQLNQPKLITNDVVKVISNTEFEWLGRIDNVINTGGIKIHPEQIEVQLADAVELPFFITGVPDEKSGEHVALVVETDNVNENLIEGWKKAFNRLEKIERPKSLLLAKSFERTENGKVKRSGSLRKAFVKIDL